MHPRLPCKYILLPRYLSLTNIKQEIQRPRDYLFSSLKVIMCLSTLAWMSSLLTANRTLCQIGKYGATHAYHNGLVRTIIC
jgi:hypothetical protein